MVPKIKNPDTGTVPGGVVVEKHLCRIYFSFCIFEIHPLTEVTMIDSATQDTIKELVYGVLIGDKNNTERFNEDTFAACLVKMKEDHANIADCNSMELDAFIVSYINSLAEDLRKQNYQLQKQKKQQEELHEVVLIGNAHFHYYYEVIQSNNKRIDVIHSKEDYYAIDVFNVDDILDVEFPCIYILPINNGVKIGKTKNIKERISTLVRNAGNFGLTASKVYVLFLEFECYSDAENKLHKELAKYRKFSEFFNCSVEDVIDVIDKIIECKKIDFTRKQRKHHELLDNAIEYYNKLYPNNKIEQDSYSGRDVSDEVFDAINKVTNNSQAKNT